MLQEEIAARRRGISQERQEHGNSADLDMLERQLDSLVYRIDKLSEREQRVSQPSADVIPTPAGMCLTPSWQFAD